MTPPPLRHLWPNVGAEEGDPRPLARRAPVASTRRLWAGLFDAATTPLPGDFAPDWAEVAAAQATPALRCLDETRGLVAWLATPEAARVAAGAGVPLFGPAPDVVAAVHDKAFAIEHAREAGLEPGVLRDRIEVHASESLRDPAGAVADALRRLAEGGPKGGEAALLIKPRLGTSGRAHVRVSPGADDLAALARRIRPESGLVFEPILDRVTDLSVALWLSRPGQSGAAPPLTVIAALRPLVPRSGAWRGHTGEIDARGRIYSGTPDDDAMREAAASIAAAAHARGFHGPCGVDGFRFRHPGAPDRTELRPIVELNARFTMGHVCAGWLRRLLPWLVATRGLAPGRRMGFVFALAPPRRRAGWHEVAAEPGHDVVPLPFALPGDPGEAAIELARLADDEARAAAASGPALVLDPEPERLAPLVDELL